MEHQGIKYTVVQTINPPGWKWSFERDGRSPRTGIAFNRAEASAQLNERSADRSEISNANRSARFAACFNLNLVSVILGRLPLDPAWQGASADHNSSVPVRRTARALLPVSTDHRLTPGNLRIVPARNEQSARYSADKGALCHYHRAALSIYRWCERNLRSRSAPAAERQTCRLNDPQDNH